MLRLGVNTIGLTNQAQHHIPNYNMMVHLHSSTPTTSRAVFPGSLGSPSSSLYDDVMYSLFHNGFVIANSPFVIPIGVYLSPVPTDNLNNVDIWIHSQPYHGVPLIQVSQTAGSFTKNFVDYAEMPLEGFIKLDMFSPLLTQIYRNPHNPVTKYSIKK